MKLGDDIRIASRELDQADVKQFIDGAIRLAARTVGEAHGDPKKMPEEIPDIGEFMEDIAVLPDSAHPRTIRVKMPDLSEWRIQVQNVGTSPLRMLTARQLAHRGHRDEEPAEATR